MNRGYPSIPIGSVVMVTATGQCGTLFQVDGDTAWVILRSLEMWIGLRKLVRLPFDQEEMDSAPIVVPRFDPAYQKTGRDY